MKETQNIFEIARLIAKSSSRQINSAEQKKLDSWENESLQNKKLFEKINDWDNFQERNSIYKSIDSEQAWEKFSKHINKSKKVVRLKFYKYAAAILIPLMIFGGMFYYLIDKQEKVSEQLVSIQPGTQNAVIILDDGNTINLEDGQLDQLVEEDGSVIQNKKGELSYNNAKSKPTGKQLQNTLLVPRGGEYNLVLSDGSRIYLNSISKLTYPVVFNGSTREVSLEGEAYFEVAKDKHKPFIVNINGMKIEVLGTSFNVKAYNDENEIAATLVEGKIKLNAEESDDEWILTPDQQAVFEKETNQVTVQEVDVQQFIGWKNGVFYFTDQPVEDIMITLSRWYDFDYVFEKEELKSIRFEGGLNKYENINPILDIMQSTGKLEYKIEGKKITFIQN